MEVMVALMILGISFTSLILVQARAVRLSLSSKNISIATQLARLKLSECKMEAQKMIPSASDMKIEGDFKEEGFEDFSWECHAPRPKITPPSASRIGDLVKGSTDQSTSVNSSILQMVTENIGSAFRELVVIIRWQENNSPEEMRVTTHVIDLESMANLTKIIQGGNALLNKKSPEPGEMPQSPAREQP